MNYTSRMPDESQAADDEISLLELLAIVAEHWLLLLIVPVLAGLVAFGVASQQPETWRSSAVIAFPQAEVSHHLQSVFNGENTAFADLDVPITDIEQGLTISGGHTEEQTRIELKLADSIMVERALEAVLSHLHTALEAQIGMEIAALSDDILYRQRMIDTLQRIMEEHEADAALDVAAYALTASTLNEILSARDEQQAYRAELAGRLVSLSVEQQASPAARVGQAPPTIALIVFVGTGFVLLVAVFVWTGARKAAIDPETRSKIDRIRRAFWLAPLPPAK